MQEVPDLVSQHAYGPTQAAEFSGPGKNAVVIHIPELREVILEILEARPTAFEAGWRYVEESQAQVLDVDFGGAPSLAIAFINGIHNTLIARLAHGAALVLSPYPIYGEDPNERSGPLFSPETSLALPGLPSPLNL